MELSEAISLFEQMDEKVKSLDLDIFPAISNQHQLMITIVLVKLGFNVQIKQGDLCSTIIKAER